MYCPKCGIENPDNGKFCRKCGCDLKVVSDALSGKLTVSNQSKKKKNEKEPTWETALFLLFMSLAFFIVSTILAFQPMGTGWWFWLLFAGFTMLALGVGQVIGLKKNQADNNKISSDENTAFPESKNANALPPNQTEFVSNIPKAKYQTGDLVPPSVVTETTRKLKMNSEGETMTLPKNDK